MKYGLQQFFVFSPKEWRGVLVFLLVVLVLWCWPPSTPDLAGEKSPLTTLPGVAKPVLAPPQRFYFDPNALDSAGWVSLGLSPQPLRRLLHYRQKGGRFRRANDMYRIWDIDSAWVESVLPWVKLPAVFYPYPGLRAGRRDGQKGYPRNSSASISIAPLDINRASLSEWEALPGIGPVLAQRIVRFRQSMGGFRRVEQVAQTYGLPEPVFLSIAPHLRLDSLPQSKLPDPGAPPRAVGSLPLNHARVADLAAMGVSAPLAQAIVTYRRLYGPYQSLADLKKIPLVNDSIYQDLVQRLRW